MNGRTPDRQMAVGEADLHAYADRELDPVRCAEVQAHLVANPEDAVKVQAYAMQNLALRSLYGSIDRSGAELEVTRLAIQLEQKFQGQRRFGRVARAAAASVLFASVIWAGWAIPDFAPSADRTNPELAHRAAVAHRLFAVEVSGVAGEGAADRSSVVSWLSQKVAGVPLLAPDLTAAGYQLARDRVLPSQADPAVLLVYEHSSGGRPLTLYIGKRNSAASASSVYLQNNDVSMVHWQAGPLAYSLVGRIDRKTLLRLAGDIGTQLAAPPALPKRHVRRSPKKKPKISRAAPLRAEPAVVRPLKADSRDAADEPRNATEERSTPKPPVAKPAVNGDVRQPEKT